MVGSVGWKTLLIIPVNDVCGHGCKAIFEDRGAVDEAVGERGKTQRRHDPVLPFTYARHRSALRWSEVRIDVLRQSTRRLARHGLLIPLLEAQDEVRGEGEYVSWIVGTHDIASQSDE